MKKTLFALIFSLSVILFFGIGVYAFDDMPNDWSTPALQSAVDNGLLSGDGNLLKPRDSLTRAQLATIMVRAFDSKNEADLSEFTDIPENAWYRSSMAKAYYMNVFRGDGAGHMNPESAVTREEAFVVLARCFCLDENADASVLDKFTDASLVSSWAKGAVASMVSEEYVNGSGGKLNPRGNITRAEFAQLMYNLVSLFADDASDLEKINGLQGNVILRSNFEKVQNISLTGELIIADGITSSIVFENADVDGRIVVRGASHVTFGGSTDSIVATVCDITLTLSEGANVGKTLLTDNSTLIDNSNPTQGGIVNPPSSDDDMTEEDIFDKDENLGEEDIFDKEDEWTEFV